MDEDFKVKLPTSKITAQSANNKVDCVDTSAGTRAYPASVYGLATAAGVGVESTKVGKSERTAEATTQRAALPACVRPNEKGGFVLNAVPAPMGVPSIASRPCRAMRT